MNGVYIFVTKWYSYIKKMMKSDGTKAYFGEIPADQCAGNHVIFIYRNIFEYHHVGDAKTPLLPVIDSNYSLKNASACELEPTRRHFVQI